MPTYSLVPPGTATQYPAVNLVDEVGNVVSPGTSFRSTMPTNAVSETIPRTGRNVEALASLLSGRLSLFGISLSAGQIITSASFVSASTALVTGSNQWFSLYSPARVKLRVTNDDTTTAWAVNTIKTLTFTTPYTVPTAGMYYLGIVVVAATVPNLYGVATSATIAGIAPVLSGTSSTGLTDPASAPTNATITAGVTLPYAYVS